MSTMYGHCYRCGVQYRREEDLSGSTLLMPQCECAGDPPVDQSGDDWLRYLGAAHYLHYEPKRDGVPVSGVLTVDQHLLVSLLDEAMLANGVPPYVVGYDASGRAVMAWLDTSNQSRPRLVMVGLYETTAGFYVHSAQLPGEFVWPLRVLERS